MIRKTTFLRKKDCIGEENDDSGYVDVSVCDLKHPPQLSPMPEGLSTQQVVRRLILGSILQSENSYLDSLKRIVQHYQTPLLEPQKLILNPKTVCQIFYRVQEIYQCHAMFQIALASRVAEWDLTEKIGDLFVASFSKSMVLNFYSDYINNFTNAMTLIKKACISKPAFLDFLKKKQASSPDRITLYGLMVKPIQRFPQFILLLQDMLKNTPMAHKDRLPLQLALTELEILAEKLNEHKRLADQETEVQQLMNSIGERNLRKFLKSEQRQLIHCELLTEIIYSEKGQVMKSKQRKIFLFNNILMCANVNLKGSPDLSSLVPAAPRYTVKWCWSLLNAQVVEVGHHNLPSEHTMSSATWHSSTSSKAGEVYESNPNLYQELEELQHDLAIVEEVTLLVNMLIGTYQNLNTAVSVDWSLALQKLIHLKQEQIQNANKCRLSLCVPGKPDKCGRPVNVMVVFNTPSPLSKIFWVNRLHMAKMATRHENTPGWECTEDEGQLKAPLSCPLLTYTLPVLCSRSPSLKLETALHCPSPSSLLGLCTASTSLPQGYLWVAGGGRASTHGQIQILSLNQATPRLVKTISLRAPIRCMEYVKEWCPCAQDQDANKTPAAAMMGNIICVGLEDGSIYVYSSVDTAVHCRLILMNHDISPVVSLKHSQSFLFAGLANGKVAVYYRSSGEQLWDIHSCKLVCVGSEPVCTLLPLEDTVWAGWSNQVTVIHGCSLLTKRFEAHPDPGCKVSHMVCSGGGVWMAFTQGSSIHLFHTDTLEQLQEVNVSTGPNHVTPGPTCVSSLLISQGLLWVGTTQGIILAFTVPTLEGIPKIRGKGMVSLNAHSGPVDFLVAATNALASDMFRGHSICNSSDDSGCQGGGRTNVGGTAVGQRLEQDQDSKPVKQKSKGVLLQYRLHSTQKLPGKLLTGQADQSDLVDQVAQADQMDRVDKTNQGALTANPDFSVHNLEDGSIYEVNEDPGVWVRGQPVDRGKEREARRSRITSTAVFSGGRGYRRIGQSAAIEPECTGNTLLIWQLCLALSQ